MTVPLIDEQNEDATAFAIQRAFAHVGADHARLLAGSESITNGERHEEHLRRLGPLSSIHETPESLRNKIDEAGLVGRGGGEFPLARKLTMAAQSPGIPLVVINASEGEPASRKDETLILLRPHLVLDGAEVVASAVGSREVVVYLHRGRRDLREAIERAIVERERHDVTQHIRIVEAPDRYVAGEASAVVAYLDHGQALPRRSAIPVAASGVHGRPTIVSNTETYAHVALLSRFGAEWFRAVGSRETTGSTLLTLAGAVAEPGRVVELLAPSRLGSILSTAGGIDRAPRAILLGGYAGTWIDGEVAWDAVVDRHALRRVGVPLGCGLIAVLDHGDCGLAETARLLGWLADQSAGQCGPCVTGLPVIAHLASEIAAGQARRRDLKRLREIAVAVRGRGACGHPTGAVELLESALDTFADEVREHLRGRRCLASGRGLPLPGEPTGGRR